MKSRKKWEVSNCCSVSLVYGLWLRHAFVEVRSSSVQYYMTWSFISDVEHLLPVQPQMCLQNGSCRTQVVSLSILLFYNSLEHSELFYSCMYMCLTKKKQTQNISVDCTDDMEMAFSSPVCWPSVQGYFIFEVLLFGSDLKWRVWSSVIVKHKHVC